MFIITLCKDFENPHTLYKECKLIVFITICACVCVCARMHPGRKSCYSIVNLVAKLWAGDLGFDSWMKQEIFLFPKHPGQLWGPSRLLFNGYQDYFPRSTAASLWSWPLLSSTKVKNVWSYTCTPTCLHGMERDISYTLTSDCSIFFPSTCVQGYWW
jgi:hypothetical protein